MYKVQVYWFLFFSLIPTLQARQQKLIKLGGNHLIVSLILTVLWGLLCPLLLFCSITALVMSVRVSPLAICNKTFFHGFCRDEIKLKART